MGSIVPATAFARAFFGLYSRMYCLQWLIPVLLIPKPIDPAFVLNHVMFMVFYLFGFFVERKPCTICSLIFILAVALLCSSGYGGCIFWPGFSRTYCDLEDETGDALQGQEPTGKLDGSCGRN